MNSLWPTSDDKPFITAEWNRNLHMHVDSAGFLPNSMGSIWAEDYTFTSPLEPGTDGNCVAMIYIRDQQPWWKTYPCKYHISSYWICKKQPRTRNAIQGRGYPSLTCKNGSLLIHDICYEYKIKDGLQNDYAVCHAVKPYFLYFNQILAYHGIKVIFVHRCTVKMTYKKQMQIEIAFSKHVSKLMITNERMFGIQETEPHYSMCGPTMQQCLDKSCRAQSSICQLDFKCAPKVCACMIGNYMNYNIEYCRYQCPPGICVCAQLMFQCSTGGCIPYAHVCDNVYDCTDISDEFCIPSIINELQKHRFRGIDRDFREPSNKSSPFCFDFICLSGKCIDVHLVNDLLPDCLDADDESHSLSIKYEGLNFRCRNVEAIPCFPGHSKCFEINKLCLYDHDSFGHISYCRDGAHLKNCRHIQCTNTFKCPLSHCIPLRKVCDGNYDCYNGEDEYNCHDNICPGYLKCREAEFCIHPSEVCDRYSHCPHGDDEELCDIVGCPSGCTCLGHSALCREQRLSYIPVFHFNDIKYLSMGSNYTYFPTFTNLSELSTLIILDLSHSMIFNICQAFQTDYKFYRSLHALYLEHNDIKYLSYTCFTKLSSILVISLQGNPLISIADDAFRGVSSNVLIIRKTRLISLSNQWINGFHSLKLLDIQEVELHDFQENTVYSLNTLEMIYTQDIRLCCVLKNVHGCHEAKMGIAGCRLLSNSIVGPVLIVLASATAVFIMISLWYIYKFYANSSPSQCLIQTSILINRLLCVCYVISIVIIDAIHGEYYIFWRTSLSSRFLYQVLYIFLSSGMVMSNVTTSLLDHITQMAVTGMPYTQGPAYSKVRIFLFSSHLLVITLFIMLILFTHDLLNNRFSANRLCSTALGLSLVNYNWSAVCPVAPVIIAITNLISYVYSIFANIVIYTKTHSSGKRVQSVASTEIDNHSARLVKLLTTLCHSTVFRSLECLPTISIVVLAVCGTGISLETQLVLILTSVSFGCLCNTTASVWKRKFSHRRIWVPLHRETMERNDTCVSMYFNKCVIIMIQNKNIFHLVFLYNGLTNQISWLWQKHNPIKQGIKQRGEYVRLLCFTII